MEMSKFEQLPNEILLKIFYNPSISAEDSISLSNVCKRFQNFLNWEDKLWKLKFEQRWPSIQKNLVVWNMKNSQVENWKEEVEDSMKISKKLEEILNNSKNKKYDFKNMPWSILTSIYETINVRKFAHLIALNVIREFINEARKTTGLTNLFYCQKILYHLNYHLLSQELKQFLQLPPKRKTLEKGVYYLSKGLHPEAFLGYEYEEISLKLDNLAHEVQSLLRTRYPSHPAISIELFSPEEPLENSKWSDEDSYELFLTIDDILCPKHTIREVDNIYNIFLHKQVKGDPVFDGYFTAIYIAVSHRLGIPLQPIKLNKMLLFKWKTSSLEYVNIFHPYKHLGLDDLREREKRYIVSGAEYPIEQILMDFAYDLFYDSERKKPNDFFLDRVAASGMILVLQIFSEDIIQWFSDDTIVFCLENEFYLEEVILVCDKLLKVRQEYDELKDLIIPVCDKLLKVKPELWDLDKIRNFSARAESLLTKRQRNR